MKSKTPPRRYDMTTRAKAAEQTGQDIARAVYDLWREGPVGDITLEAVAERAGVSTRTILRRFGSKEGLFEYAISQDAGNILSDRNQIQPGDIEGAIDILVEQYEKHGDANIRALAQEEELPAMRNLLETARDFHRKWIARVFEEFLPDPSDPNYQQRLHAFIAATEIYLWKVLRQDFDRSLEETKAVYRDLIYSLIDRYHPS